MRWGDDERLGTGGAHFSPCAPPQDLFDRDGQKQTERKRFEDGDPAISTTAGRAVIRVRCGRKIG